MKRELYVLAFRYSRFSQVETNVTTDKEEALREFASYTKVMKEGRKDDVMATQDFGETTKGNYFDDGAFVVLQTKFVSE